MYVFNMHIQCVDHFIEVLSEELGTAELVVEDLISQVLLALFDTVIVEEVSIFPSGQSSHQAYYLLHIYAQCADIFTPSFAAHLDDLELTIEEKICCVLIELFGTVHLEKITISTE
jgi:hypothetical protein